MLGIQETHIKGCGVMQCMKGVKVGSGKGWKQYCGVDEKSRGCVLDGKTLVATPSDQFLIVSKHGASQGEL